MTRHGTRRLPLLALCFAPSLALAEPGLSTSDLGKSCAPHQKAPFEDTPLARRCRRLAAYLRSHDPVRKKAASVVLAGLHPSPLSGDAGDDDDLRVATLNTGLLYISGGYSVPHGEERRLWIADAIRAQAAQDRALDVLLLQEVYRAEDRELLTRVANESGYTVIDTQQRDRHRTGLLTLVGKRLTVTPERTGFHRLQGDTFAVAGYVRGIQWTEAKTQAGQRVILGNVHLTPTSFASLSWRRTQQVVELAEAVDEGIGPFGCLSDNPSCAVIVGGDFNLSPWWDWSVFPGFQDWPEKKQRAYDRWLYWDESIYQLLLAVFDAEADANGELGPSLDPSNPVWEGYKVAGIQPNRRVDLLFVRGGVVDRSEISFNEQVEGSDLYLSDHYGVTAALSLATDTSPTATDAP